MALFGFVYSEEVQGNRYSLGAVVDFQSRICSCTRLAVLAVSLAAAFAELSDQVRQQSFLAETLLEGLFVGTVWVVLAGSLCWLHLSSLHELLDRRCFLQRACLCLGTGRLSRCGCPHFTSLKTPFERASAPWDNLALIEADLGGALQRLSFELFHLLLKPRGVFRNCFIGLSEEQFLSCLLQHRF